MQKPLFHIACATTWAANVLAWSHVDSHSIVQALEQNDFVFVALVNVGAHNIQPSEAQSQALEAEWSAVAEGTSDPVLSIDCIANAPTCSGVESYPTIKALGKGHIGELTYPGPRRADAILNFFGRFKRPVVSEVTSESLRDFKVIDETVFIGFISAADEPAKQAFGDVAVRHYDEFSFGLVSDPRTIEEQNIKSPAIICYKPRDRDSFSLSSFTDADALNKLVLEASRPVIGELTPRNHQRFLDRGWPMVYIFAPAEVERAKLRMAMAKTARSYHESLTVVTVDPLEFPDLPAKLGLEPGAYPAGAVHQLSTDRIYPYPKERSFDSKSLQQWGLDVYSGRVKPWTPPGTTTTFENLGPTKVATRKFSINTRPGMKIKIAGHDEL